MPQRNVTSGGWLHLYARLVVLATFLLIIAGGLVTSTDSGLAVPDWPLSYGMFFPPMVGGIFYEHGHRMIAGTVGLMTLALTVWIWRKEERAWVRKLGVAALVTVVIQALLGGITVLWMLPPVVSTSHLGTAMAFFALVTALAIVTSTGWQRAVPARPVPGAMPLTQLAGATTLIVYGQILLGAAMRHTGAGLACPDFPLCNGAALPDLSPPGVALHMAHRLGALLVVCAVVYLADRTWGQYPDIPELRRPALAALFFVGFQALLGALSVLSGLSVGTTTAHVAGGAALLCSLVVLTLRAHRRLGRTALPTGRNEPGATARATA